MPDWNKIAKKRADNAVKAISLLERTAGDDYEFTEEEGRGLLSKLENALTALKQVYAPRIGEEDNDVPISTMAPEQNDGEEEKYVDHLKIVENTDSTMPVVIPHWSQRSDFVNTLKRDALPSYMALICNRIYEDNVLEAKK